MAIPPGYCWTINSTTSTIDNPVPGEYLVIKGFTWTITHDVVSIKVDHLQVKCSPKGGTAIPASIRVALTKTGDGTPATTFHNIPLSADGVTHDLAVIDFSTEMTLSIAEAASGNVGIILDWSDAFVNCEIVVFTSTSSIQVGESATVGTVTGNGIVYGEYGGCDEYVVVSTGGIYSINGQFVDGASANNWSSNLAPTGTTLNALFWEGCQFGSEEFITEPSTGVFRRTICGKDQYGADALFVPLYQDYQHPGSNGNAIAALSIPPYTPHAFDHTADTISLFSNTMSSGTVALSIDTAQNKPTLACTISSTTTTGAYEYEIDLGTAIDFSRAGEFMPYLMLHYVFSHSQNGSGQASDGDDASFHFQNNLANFQIRFADSVGFSVGHQTAYLPAGYSSVAPGNQRDVFVWFDLNSVVGNAVMAGVKKLRIRIPALAGNTGGRNEYLRLDEFIPLGQYYHYTATNPMTTAIDPSTDGLVTWAYNYTEGANIGKGVKIEMTAAQALGTRYDPKVPYGGSFVTLTIPSAPAPFTTAALQNLYRQETHTNQWQRVAQSAGSTDPFIFLDTLTDGEIVADTVTYPIVPLVIEPLTAADSGQATNMISCVSAFGSLIFFGTDGQAYGSQTNNPQVFFWPNVNPDLTGVADNEVPRTLQIANNRGLPVLVGIFQQALYMFTRKEAYIMRSLSTFALADFPAKLTGCRGVCGTRAACPFEDGALYGSDDGLWYIAVNPYQPTVGGDEKPAVAVEITATNRGLWAKLIGDATQRVNLVVQTTGQDIWCTCENRYIHVDMRRGRVLTYGEWASGKEVAAAHGDPKRGMVWLASDGPMNVMGPYLTDGGLDLAGLTGTPPNWYWKSKRFTSAMNLLAARAVWENQLSGSQPDMGAVTAFSERGSVAGDSIALTDSEGVGTIPFDSSIVQQNAKPGGDWFEIEVSGAAWDKVTRMEIHATTGQPKRLTR